MRLLLHEGLEAQAGWLGIDLLTMPPGKDERGARKTRTSETVSVAVCPNCKQPRWRQDREPDQCPSCRDQLANPGRSWQEIEQSWHLSRLQESRVSRHAPKPERDAELIRLRATGLTYAQLGRQFQISTERARQIVKRGEGR